MVDRILIIGAVAPVVLILLLPVLTAWWQRPRKEDSYLADPYWGDPEE